MEVIGQFSATAVLPQGKELPELFHSHLRANLSPQNSFGRSLDGPQNQYGGGGEERNVRPRQESKSDSPGI
jgi:hypothetical protein